MSAGDGSASQIWYSGDAGKNWTQQFRNGSSKAFYDCMGFWDEKHGIAVSDGVDDNFRRLPRGRQELALLSEAASPPARPGECSFAASGTCLVTRGDQRAWFGTGAAVDGYARVIRTTDEGRTWRSADTPIATSASAGIATVAFRDDMHGVAMGGNIAKPDTFTMNVAVSSDGGANWEAGGKCPSQAQCTARPMPWRMAGRHWSPSVRRAPPSRGTTPGRGC